MAPYYPSSNGQVEQETKQLLRRASDGDAATKLACFLLSQHVLPHSTTGKSPAEMLMGRRLHTALDELHTDLLREMGDKQKKTVATRHPEGAILTSKSLYSTMITLQAQIGCLMLCATSSDPCLTRFEPQMVEFRSIMLIRSGAVSGMNTLINLR